MNLGELVNGLGVRLVTPGAGAVRVCDVTEDSRTAVPGSLFIARCGRKADGRRFVMDAVRAGATAVLTDDAGPLVQGGEGGEGGEGGRGSASTCPVVAVCEASNVNRAAAMIAERFYGNASHVLDVVGVTGTNGKTTIAWLVWQILNASGTRCGLVGTVVVDDGREVARATMTTPPAIELSRAFAEMVDAGCRAVALEASSHSLDQDRVAAVSFDIAVFTNLTQDHLDYHQTMDEYANAKAKLFERLPTEGCAIVNADDHASVRMLRDCRAKVVRCRIGERAVAPIKADEATVGIAVATIRGMELDLAGAFGRIHASVPLIGAYNAMNVLQAASVCAALGLNTDQLTAGLAKIFAPPGRLEALSDVSDDIAVFVDYAHTDDGLRSVLAACAGVKGSGHLWVVFGAGGDKDKTKRPKMGRAAADFADVVIVTSDNPRTETPSAIVDMILAGIPPDARGKVQVQVDRRLAIQLAVSGAAKGDVVVIAGKGHETEQILPDGKGGTIEIHFDDREVARTALAHRRSKQGERPAVRVMPKRTIRRAGDGSEAH